MTGGRDYVPLPPESVVADVDRYVGDCYRDAARFENVDLLDSGQVYSLHRLAATIYVAGQESGERAEAARARGENARTHDERREQTQALHDANRRAVEEHAEAERMAERVNRLCDAMAVFWHAYAQAVATTIEDKDAASRLLDGVCADHDIDADVRTRIDQAIATAFPDPHA